MPEIPTGMSMMLKMIMPGVEPDKLIAMIMGIAENAKKIADNQNKIIAQNEEILTLLKGNRE